MLINWERDRENKKKAMKFEEKLRWQSVLSVSLDSQFMNEHVCAFERTKFTFVTENQIIHLLIVGVRVHFLSALTKRKFYLRFIFAHFLWRQNDYFIVEIPPFLLQLKIQRIFLLIPRWIYFLCSPVKFFLKIKLHIIILNFVCVRWSVKNFNYFYGKRNWKVQKEKNEIRLIDHVMRYGTRIKCVSPRWTNEKWEIIKPKSIAWTKHGSAFYFVTLRVNCKRTHTFKWILLQWRDTKWTWPRIDLLFRSMVLLCVTTHGM